MGSKRQQNVTAIIYDKRGRVLSIGKNSYIKTHPLQKHYALKANLPHKQLLHAEIDAIRRCKYMHRAHRIVVIRTLADGSTGNAKPCPICQRAIESAGISHIEHT